MLPSFLLSLREGVEAALIIGILLGALRKMQRAELSRVVWSGAISAVLLSALAALVLYGLGASFEGRAEEIFEGVTMILAAGVLTWMIFWMRRQAHTLKAELDSGVRRATLQGGGRGLFSLAFLAVLREGIELALFLVAASVNAQARGTLIGAGFGLGGAILLGWLLFATTMRLDLGGFFRVTGVLMVLFAAGLFAHGVHEFNEAGLVPVIVEHVWDTNLLLDERSFLGEMAKTLFGYNGNPSLSEVLAYAGYFAVIALGLWRDQRKQSVVVGRELP